MHKNITLFSALLPVFLCYYTIESKNKFLFLYTLSFYELKKEIFYMKNNNTKKIEYITYNQKILERIKIELTRQKISQKTLAQLCNVSQPTISKLLKGDSPLTLEFIYKVSEKLDMSSPIVHSLMYCLSSFTTSSKSVMLLRPLTCHIPVSPGLVARRAR